jgi:hypothetical protein
VKRNPPTAIELALIAAPIFASQDNQDDYELAIRQAWILWEQAVLATYQCDTVEIVTH